MSHILSGPSSQDDRCHNSCLPPADTGPPARPTLVTPEIFLGGPEGSPKRPLLKCQGSSLYSYPYPPGKLNFRAFKAANTKRCDPPTLLAGQPEAGSAISTPDTGRNQGMPEFRGTCYTAGWGSSTRPWADVLDTFPLHPHGQREMDIVSFLNLPRSLG